VHQVLSWSHETDLLCEPQSAALARDFVTAHLVEHGFALLVEDLRLVTSELASNAVLHARTAFSVVLAGDDVSVLLTVRDASALRPTPLPAWAAGTRGRGLAIVGQLSRQWGTTPDADGGKSVWARFEAGRSAERRPPLEQAH
jgi:anti-sigma regulatory factor (Ser/Thr protein kinase)